MCTTGFLNTYKSPNEFVLKVGIGKLNETRSVKWEIQESGWMTNWSFLKRHEKGQVSKWISFSFQEI